MNPCNPAYLRLVLTLAFSTLTCVPVSNSASITIESTRTPQPLEYDCVKVKFPSEHFVTCLCLDGLWAISITTINHPSSWRILGGQSKNKTQRACYHINEWVSRFERVSKSTTKSSLRKLKEKSNKFLVTNKDDWEVQVTVSDEKGDENGEMEVKVCLPSDGMSSYCIYDLDSQLKYKVKGTVRESEFKIGCSPKAVILKAQECGSMFPKGDEPNILGGSSCSLIPPKASSNRFKRDLTALNGTEEELLNEDFVNPDDAKKKMGHPDMMASVVDFVKLDVAQRMEASFGRRKGKKKSGVGKGTPTQLLLQICKEVAQQACSPVSSDTFTISTNSFLTQQLGMNHMKESYMSFTAFQRTLDALEKCRAEARPFIFFNSNESTCETQLPRDTANMIKRQGQNITLPEVPAFAAGDPALYDPLIETVWKTFLMAHSLCFKYFVNHFNDHHTWTVAMIPFFTNKIQEIWFLPPQVDATSGAAVPVVPGTPVSYVTDTVWYGNLLGNAGKLMEQIDNCYQASRIPSGLNPSDHYPWFMRRPARDLTNEWMQRKKRSVEDSDSSDEASTTVSTVSHFVKEGKGSCSGHVR